MIPGSTTTNKIKKFTGLNSHPENDQKFTNRLLKKKISNHDYTRKIMLKRVTSGGAPLRGLAPGQYSSEETSQRWRAVGDTMSYLTDSGLEPQTSRTDSNV